MASYENVMPLNTRPSIMRGCIVQIGSVQLTLLTPERSPSEDRGLYLGFYGERVTGIRCGNEKASIVEAWYCMERVTGIEPAWSAWKAEVLPLNYTRVRMKYTTVEFSAARNMLPTYRVHMFRGY